MENYEKIIITLEDGSLADVDEESFENMKQAIKKGNPKQITKYAVECLISSDKLMDDLVTKMFKGLEEKRWRNGRKKSLK